MPDKPTREDLRQLLLGKCKQIENQDTGRGCITLTCVDVHHLVRHLCRPYKVSQVCQDFQEQNCHDCEDLTCGDNTTPTGRLLKQVRKLIARAEDGTLPTMEDMMTLAQHDYLASGTHRRIRKAADGGD